MTFPYSDCPPADDLLAYHVGSVVAMEERARIERHLKGCANCRRVLEQLAARDQPASGTGQVRERAATAYSAFVKVRMADEQDRLATRLAEQQGRMARMLAEPRPEPLIGQVWTLLTRAHSATAKTATTERPEHSWFLVAVLGVHQSQLERGSRFANLAPVTEDPRLASEWSLVLDPPDSGIGTTAVIHVDHERSASVSCLKRCIGRLPEPAGEDLLTLLRGWSRGETPSARLRVGRLGQSVIRTRPDWRAFDAWLGDSMQTGCGGWDGAEGDGAGDGDASIAAVPTEARVSAAGEWRIADARRQDAKVPPATSGPTVGAASSPGGDSSESSSAPFESFVGQTRAFLTESHGGDLARWCRIEGVSALIAWDDVTLLEAIPLAKLFNPDVATKSEMRSRIAHLPKGAQEALRMLVTAVKYFVDRRSGALEGQSLTLNAARRQNPPSR